ncbi:MAG: hypothetical protein QM483_00285 [Desulfuromusa sp.]
MFHQRVALFFFLRQSFWVIAAGVLLVGQLQVLPRFIAFSTAAEYSCPTFNSLPSGCFIALVDSDEGSDCLPFLTPEIILSIATALLCQQSSLQLLTSAVESFSSLFARPPPVILFCFS